jgi:hypothetical protein
MIAGALGFTEATTGVSSRYVGLPQIQIPTENWSLIIAIVAILSAVAGIGLGLIISGISPKKEKVHKKWVQKRIDDYKKMPKYPYFSKEDMPRSIKDYYKKTK